MRASLWVVALALAFTAALLSVVCADKRAEMSPAPFVMGSRYGRSPHRLVAPRNDRFFMGSRYGKRSEAPSGAAGWAAGWAGSRDLVCEYTGVYSLYRCAYRDHPRVERRSSDEESLPGESD
ncbi:RYamide neuropeptides [Manduca sexta]|uniref:RYamide neuropeptides n=1 Tax=Manduca sexta TaxID=7130 RepID=UPI001182D0A5|nr:RYamide neuropeptides [Manduca sexta]